MQKSLRNVVPFMGNRNKLCTMTKNPIIQNTFGSWQDAHLSIDSKGSLFKTLHYGPTQIFQTPQQTALSKVGWTKKLKQQGIHTQKITDTCSSFQQLSRKYYFPHHNLFKSDIGSKKTHPEDFLTYRRRPLWRTFAKPQRSYISYLQYSQQ